jgi:hypothetical protein
MKFVYLEVVYNLAKFGDFWTSGRSWFIIPKLDHLKLFGNLWILEKSVSWARPTRIVQATLYQVKPTPPRLGNGQRPRSAEPYFPCEVLKRTPSSFASASLPFIARPLLPPMPLLCATAKHHAKESVAAFLLCPTSPPSRCAIPEESRRLVHPASSPSSAILFHGHLNVTRRHWPRASITVASPSFPTQPSAFPTTGLAYHCRSSSARPRHCGEASPVSRQPPWHLKLAPLSARVLLDHFPHPLGLWLARFWPAATPQAPSPLFSIWDQPVLAQVHSSVSLF